jgi:hypothetical protein
MTAAAMHTASTVCTNACAAGISAPCHDVAADLGSTWATRPTPRRGSHPSAANEAACARAQVAAVVRLSCRPLRSQHRFASHALRSEARPADRGERVFARALSTLSEGKTRGGCQVVSPRAAFSKTAPKTAARLLCIPLPLRNVRHGRLEFYVAPSSADRRQFFYPSNLAAKINMPMIVDQSALAASIGSESGRDCERSARRCDGGAGAEFESQQYAQQAQAQQTAGIQEETARRRDLTSNLETIQAIRAGRGVGAGSPTAMSIYDSGISRSEDDIAAGKANAAAKADLANRAALLSERKSSTSLLAGDLGAFGDIASGAFRYRTIGPSSWAPPSEGLSLTGTGGLY